MWKCVNCGNNNSDDLIVCSSCEKIKSGFAPDEVIEKKDQRCKYCLKIFPENATFCPFCGKKAENLVDNTINQEIQPYTTGEFILFVILGVIIPIVGIIIGGINLKGSRKEQSLVILAISLITIIVYAIAFFNRPYRYYYW